MDPESGIVLFAKAADRPRPPASLVKMMLAYVVLEQVRAGRRRLDDPVRISARAESVGGAAGSTVGLKAGEVLPLGEVLKAALVASANDAAMAVAEHVGRSEDGFVDLMNAKAEELGMKDTRFVTPHGLPPGRDQEADVSSAHDMALLGRALARHPQALQWAVTKEAPFREGKFILRNPNKLVGAFSGLDGLKTGHYKEAGYNLTATAERNGLRLVPAVMGEVSGQSRFAETARLLNWGFNVVRREVVVKAGEEVAPVKVMKGVETSVKLVTAGRVTLFQLPGNAAKPDREVQVPPSVPAPVEAGQKIGTLAVKRGGQVVG
jgi:D-alanyl-D-alanine carboxypeptidase (penicillin-binding protein 5/6)